MIPLFAKIFGAGKTAETGARVVEKATDGIISGIDKMVFTDEEKAEATQKATETILALWKTFGTENSEQSKARRELAKMVFKSYFALIFLGVAVWGFNQGYAQFLFKLVSDLTGLVMMVAGAYFVPHQLSKVFTWKKE